MRHGTSNRRQRNRGNGGRRGGQQRMQVFDSNGPDVRIRGTAHQVVEKYLALAKDAASASDHVLAQSYLQHAEHYQRLINSWEEDVQSDKGQEKPKAPRRKKPANEEDELALPNSILGGDSKADSEEKSDERTAEASAN